MFLTVDLKKAWPALLAVPLIVFSLFWSDDAEETISANPPRRVLIIDAGHGGDDGGAVSPGGLVESGINLNIALRTDAIAGLYGLDTAMTRVSQDIAYPESATSISKRKKADQHARVELINSYPNAVLISIHQNFFPNPRPSGCQVLYAATDGSAKLGALTHGNLCAALCPDSRRLAIPVSEKIFLMRSIKCAGILVECGFLSNKNDAALLATPNYQTKISAVLLASYLQFEAQSYGMVT
ncbi:MAG: N-acetylmuramoyl-L-alanine amidase [Oscillospiraceae bacterium]